MRYMAKTKRSMNKRSPLGIATEEFDFPLLVKALGSWHADRLHGAQLSSHRIVSGTTFDGEPLIVYNIRKNYTHRRRIDGVGKIGT